MPQQKPENFAQFWDYYVSQHLNATCRLTHFIGTSLGFVQLVAAIATQNYWLILTGIATGYAGAWYGHFAFERNKPTSWGSPLFAVWSFASDWIMWSKIITGKMGAEVHRIEQKLNAEKAALSSPLQAA